MMKRQKRTCVKSFQPQQQSLSSTNSIITAQPEFYLPDDCWEYVFRFIIYESQSKLNFKSLSRVSKHFLSITNRLIFSLKIYHPQICYLPRFFHRFSNLNSLDLWFGCSHELDVDIALALRDIPTLKSLSIFGIELKDANYITSHYIDSFVSFKGLNSLEFRCSRISDDLLHSFAREGLPLKSFVLENCMGYSYHGIYALLSKCSGIKHLGLQGDDFLNNHHVFQLSLLLSDLESIDLSKCSKLGESALVALVKNCHSLAEITMQHIYIEGESVENYDILKDYDVYPQLKFLFLTNTIINDGTIILFASVFSNLEFLNISYCFGISKEGICQVLSRCYKLTHLNLTCNDVRGLKMNFVVRKLKVLLLDITNVDDETLYEISKSCCGLLRLSLEFCRHVTEKGVMFAIENCTQLEEINLTGCAKVNIDAVVSMLSSRPSLERYGSTLFLMTERENYFP